MEFVNCILCNSKNTFKKIESVVDRFENNNSYSIVKCSCDMVMLNPRHDINDIGEHYNVSDYQPHNKKNNFINFLYKIAQYINNKSKISIIEEYFKSGNILDFGGGDGKFTNYMIRKKWEALYFEPNLDQKQTHHITNISDLKGSKFQVITMFHAIEHIHEIHKSLNTIYNLLDDDGILVLTFPNYFAYEKIFFKDKWIAYDAPRHLYHFDMKSIKRLLNQNKFKILKNKPVYLDTLYNIIMSTDKFYKYIFVVPFQIIVSFFNILKNEKIASSILLVCSKK